MAYGLKASSCNPLNEYNFSFLFTARNKNFIYEDIPWLLKVKTL